MRWLWAASVVVVVGGLGCGGRDIGRASGEGSEQGAPGGATGDGMAGHGDGMAGHPGVGGVGGHPNGCCFSPGPRGGAPGAGGAMAGAGGATGMAGESGGMAGAPGTGGAGGVGTGPMACSSFMLGTQMTLAPAAPGQQYLRCASLGPEQGWDVTPSPGGDRLAARTAAGTVRLISTVSWTEVAQLASPVGELDALAFSPDGTTLATVSSEMGEVTLWRASDGAYLASYDGPPGSTISDNGASLAFSSDGQRLATSLGIVIDLVTGARTSWLTGAPDATVLTANAQNLGDPDQGGIPLIRFTAGDARLFVVTTYQIGNSPPSMRLELRDPATGAQALLFEMYARALLGYAISPDRRTIARAGTPEASLSTDPFGPGLFVIDATTGAMVASDPASTATPLAFSRDGARLYTLNGGAIGVLGTTDLHPIATFAWPSGATFVGLSPAGDSGRRHLGVDRLRRSRLGHGRPDAAVPADDRAVDGRRAVRRGRRRSGGALSFLERGRRHTALRAGGWDRDRAVDRLSGDDGAARHQRNGDRQHDVGRRVGHADRDVHPPRPRVGLLRRPSHRDCQRRASATVRRLRLQLRAPAVPGHLGARRRSGLHPCGDAAALAGAGRRGLVPLIDHARGTRSPRGYFTLATASSFLKSSVALLVSA